MKWLLSFAPIAGAAVLLAGCGDPVLDARIAALGGETNGVKASEFHRPGQPCTYCHSDYGGAQPFSIGGTIFGVPAEKANSAPHPVENAKVTITDTTGVPHTARTNCVGNFFLTEAEYQPQYPLHVVVESAVPGEGMVRKVMGTRIDRASSCAECHVKNASESSPGWVWVFQDPVDSKNDPFKNEPARTCQGAANFR